MRRGELRVASAPEQREHPIADCEARRPRVRRPRPCPRPRVPRSGTRPAAAGSCPDAGSRRACSRRWPRTRIRMRPGSTAGAAVSPSLSTSGPPNPSSRIAFMFALSWGRVHCAVVGIGRAAATRCRSVRAPIVVPGRSTYYTAAPNWGSLPFPSRGLCARNTEAAAAGRDPRDHDAVPRGPALRQNRLERRRLSGRAGAHARARERQTRRESDHRRSRTRRPTSRSRATPASTEASRSCSTARTIRR